MLLPICWYQPWLLFLVALLRPCHNGPWERSYPQLWLHSISQWIGGFWSSAYYWRDVFKFRNWLMLVYLMYFHPTVGSYSFKRQVSIRLVGAGTFLLIRSNCLSVRGYLVDRFGVPSAGAWWHGCQSGHWSVNSGWCFLQLRRHLSMLRRCSPCNKVGTSLAICQNNVEHGCLTSKSSNRVCFVEANPLQWKHFIGMSR